MASDTSGSAKAAAGRSSGQKCPICKKPPVEGYKPFCSKRCADVDLGKWFSNSYAIPGSEHDDEAAGAEKPASGDPDDGP